MEIRKIAISFTAILFIVFLLTGCSPSRNGLATEIEKSEASVFSTTATTFDREGAEKLLKLYDTFITEFPEDTLAPVFLYKSANLQMNATNPKDAVSRYNRLIKEYPENEKSATSLFFMGFIYENHLKDLDKAKESYLLFIEKFPNHELVKDARMSVQNLGKTPEQIIQEFELKLRNDSIHQADSIAKLK
jgi:tetratricopeptide (TPR) repeat protein